MTMKAEFIIIELTLLLFEEVLGSSCLARSWNGIIGQKWVNNREPSIKYVPKIFRKANISNPLIAIAMPVGKYQAEFNKNTFTIWLEKKNQCRSQSFPLHFAMAPKNMTNASCSAS